MSRLYMLDTKTVSYIVKGRSPAARAKLAALTGNQIACLSAITEGEMQYGLAKAPFGPAVRAAIDAFLSRIKILAWGRDEALAYGRLRARLEKAGRSLGNLDLLIAAHAIAADAVLVTSNRALARLRDLPATENWAADL